VKKKTSSDAGLLAGDSDWHNKMLFEERNKKPLTGLFITLCAS
jgi:hypothetical protein